MLCKDDFCGCQLLSFDADGFPSVSSKVYFSTAIVLLVLIGFIRLGIEWFIAKDYYPMKEKSPILCMLIIGTGGTQIVLYPLLYLYSYFTADYSQIDMWYRALWYGLGGNLYFAYLLRTLRLYYAHKTQPSQQQTVLFRLFANQPALGLLATTHFLFRAVPVLIYSKEEIPLFYTPIQFCNSFRINDEDSFAIRTMVVEMGWLLLMCLCLYLQSSISSRHSIKLELMILIISGLLLSLINLGLTANQNQNQSLFIPLCDKLQFYPAFQLIKNTSVIIMVFVATVLPLFQKRQHHIMLSTGRRFDLPQTMRNFLIEPQTLAIFSSFLAHRDSKNQLNGAPSSYLATLEVWKNLMLVKYDDNENPNNKLDNLQDIIQEIREYRIPCEQSLLLDLDGSVNNASSANVSFLSQQLDRASTAIGHLEATLLRRLDNIYREEYTKTSSYFYSKILYNDNRQVNVNMILLNLSLMVESELLTM